MTVHAVVTGVELASGIPLSERSVTGVKRGVPILVPAQEVCIFTKTFGEILFAETLINCGICQISLANKFRAWVEILLFFPMDSDLRLVDLCLLFFFFHYASVSHGMDLLISQSNRSNSHRPAGIGPQRTNGWQRLPPASPKQIILHLPTHSCARGGTRASICGCLQSQEPESRPRSRSSHSSCPAGRYCR